MTEDQGKPYFLSRYIEKCGHIVCYITSDKLLANLHFLNFLFSHVLCNNS